MRLINAPQGGLGFGMRFCKSVAMTCAWGVAMNKVAVNAMFTGARGLFGMQNIQFRDLGCLVSPCLPNEGQHVGQIAVAQGLPKGGHAVGPGIPGGHRGKTATYQHTHQVVRFKHRHRAVAGQGGIDAGCALPLASMARGAVVFVNLGATLRHLPTAEQPHEKWVWLDDAAVGMAA